ncbi:MAG: hypothetical protein MJZ93_06340 [Paludibacteraceae bacterium]|nr:hypothetical protein [Paludibacteraceae bacterium]
MGIIRDLIRMEISREKEKSMTNNKPIQTPQKRKSPSTSPLALLKCADFTSRMTIVVAVSILFFTLFFPVSADISSVLLYLRNISSIIAFAAISIYLLEWSDYNSIKAKERNLQKQLRIFTIFAITAFSIKGISSLYITFYLFGNDIYMIAYYASDGVAWIAMGLFAAIYFKFVQPAKNKSDEKRSIVWFTIVITVVCYVKAIITITYTTLNFNQNQMVWLYYLASALGWLSIVMFFTLLCNCQKILKKRGHHHTNDDKQFEMVLDKIAKEKSH